MVTFLQRTFTSLVHAHAGRTQKNQVRPLRGLGRKHVGCSLRSDFSPHVCAPYLKLLGATRKYDMPYRVKHYAQPVNVGYSVSWEAVAMELFIGAICSVMAYFGWTTGVILMAAPCAFVAFSCYVLVIAQIVLYLRER